MVGPHVAIPTMNPFKDHSSDGMVSRENDRMLYIFRNIEPVQSSSNPKHSIAIKVGVER